MITGRKLFFPPLALFSSLFHLPSLNAKLVTAAAAFPFCHNSMTSNVGKNGGLSHANNYCFVWCPSQINTSATKKLWEKGGGSSNDVKVATGAGATGPLAPLQLHGSTDHQVWRDSTWSTQGDAILASRRIFPHAPDTNPTGSTGILR